tara:strand:+ start:1655 stop:2164 length:510 start_codon:yes stop_codon:yes gene_type:complete
MANIIWFTGLSGSGKTTLTYKLYKIFKKKIKVKIIDGDNFRRQKKNKKFSKFEIIQNNLSIINYIKKIYFDFDMILVSVISPIKLTRLKAKTIFKNNYYEVYLDCKISSLEKRDTKGLYAKAKLKIIKNLIGYNSKIKYENSNYDIIKIKTDKLSISQSVKKILYEIKK